MRDQNNFQRYVEECLADRQEMGDWTAEWPGEREDDGYDPRDDWDDRDWDDWGDETYDATELEEWDNSRLLQLDLEEDYESFYESFYDPSDLEYGGRYYPAVHVRDAREVNYYWRESDE